MSKFYTYCSRYGNNILHRYIENGVPYVESTKFSPTLYVPSDEGTFSDMNGRKLAPVVFDSMKEADEFIKRYKDVSNLGVCGERSFEYQFLQENYKDTVDYNMSHVRGHILDIEVFTPDTADYAFPEPDDALSEIVSIATFDTIHQEFFVFGFHPEQTWKDPCNGKYKINYYHCLHEYDLTVRYINWHVMNMPDYWCAWNGEAFDAPYIVNRFNKIVGVDNTKRLSPFGIIKHREVYGSFGAVNNIVDIKGIQMIDYMLAYKKISYGARESYSLDYIAYHELGEKKLSYKDIGNINKMYETDYQRYIDYNIKDTGLIVELENKLHYIEVMFILAYNAKVNWSDTLGTVKIWEINVYNHLLQSGIVAPLYKKRGDKKAEYGGAYVMEPITGRYKWVTAFDLASLYPSVKIQWNIGVDSIVEDVPDELAHLHGRDLRKLMLSGGITEHDTSLLQKYDMSLSANGQLYSNEKQSFISEMLETLFVMRKKYKKLMFESERKYIETKDKKYKEEQLSYHNKQYAIKIFLNSEYGAGGASSFKYFDIRHAEATTFNGQVVVQWSMAAINKYFNTALKTKDVIYVIYADTDSVVGDTLIYVNNEKMKIEDFASKYIDLSVDGKHVVPVSGFTTKTYKDGAIVDRPIKYIMAHKTKKKMYKLTVDGKSVTVTEDHSLMVERDGSLIECKPLDLVDGDVVVTL